MHNPLHGIRIHYNVYILYYSCVDLLYKNAIGLFMMFVDVPSFTYLIFSFLSILSILLRCRQSSSCFSFVCH